MADEGNSEKSVLLWTGFVLFELQPTRSNKAMQSTRKLIDNRFINKIALIIPSFILLAPAKYTDSTIH